MRIAIFTLFASTAVVVADVPNATCQAQMDRYCNLPGVCPIVNRSGTDLCTAPLYAANSSGVDHGPGRPHDYRCFSGASLNANHTTYTSGGCYCSGTTSAIQQILCHCEHGNTSSWDAKDHRCIVPSPPLALAALVAAAAATPDVCPSCDRITNQTACQTGRHPTLVGPHGQGCDGHPQPGSVYCAWNSTIGNVTTPGCSNCTVALGHSLAIRWCQNTCRGPHPPPGIKPSAYGGDSGPNPVVIQGCSPKGGPDCKTNDPGNYQWACYNPDAVNANHTAWDGHTGFGAICRGNEEIRDIISRCSCKTRGGCPPQPHGL